MPVPEIRILHYHLFKNAGTSVDKILRGHFGGAWEQREFDGIPHLQNHLSVGAWIDERRDRISAFSSHTAMGPLPSVAEGRVFSLLFVRHPIDRLRSAYDFERKQQAPTFGSKLARETSLAGYIAGRLANPGERFARNFHAYRLASFVRDAALGERERALRALDLLDVVGVVEHFDRSIAILNDRLRQYFPGFHAVAAKENVGSAGSRPLAQRLYDMRVELGEELWAQLVEANLLDLEIHEAAHARLLLTPILEPGSAQRRQAFQYAA